MPCRWSQCDLNLRGAEDVIICIVSSRKMREIKDAVLDIDPIAFMTISSVQEVSGRGFSLDRKTGLV